MSPQPPKTLPADFFSKPIIVRRPTDTAPDTLPANFFSDNQQQDAPKPAGLKDEGFLDSAWQALTGIPKAIAGTVQQAGHNIVHGLSSPPGTLGKEQDEKHQQNMRAIEEMTPDQRKEWLLRSIPLASTVYKAANGNVGGAAGDIVGSLPYALLPSPGRVQGKPTARVPLTPKIINPNAAEASALSFLEGEGVPVSAGAKTGNAFVKNIQKAADSTPLGAMVAKSSETATTEALQATSKRLAGRANETPGKQPGPAVVPEQAGADLRGAIKKTAESHAADADTAYEQFRQIESDPANIRSVQQGVKQAPQVNVQGNPIPGKTTAAPIMEDVALPTNLKSIKDMLAPIVADMDKWMEPAKRNSSAGYQAAKSILNGPDNVPASVAEAGLGGLKQLAREGAGRNAGLAKLVVPKLQTVIDDAVSQANSPDAIKALQAGRTSTAAQYGTKAVLDQLRQEPVQTFGQMTYAKDAGVELLRKASKEAPFEMRKIGRAYLEDLFGKAQSQGGWTGADGLFSKWRDLGPETKRIIFSDPQLVSDLDKFFLGAKKIAENPNPSGTAIVGLSAASGAGMVLHPATGVPLVLGAGAISKLMHSSAGVRLLTKGISMPVNAPAAALTLAAIRSIAGRDLQPAAKVAEDDQSQQTESASLAGVRR